jgi:uncharacterized membrane protein YccC
MSNLSLARTAGVGAGDRLTKSGDGPHTHQLAAGVTFSVLTWLWPIVIAAAARVRRLTRQALSRTARRSRTKSGSTPASARLVDFKARESTWRFAVAMRRCASAIESSRFVFRCSLAASVAYGLATLVGFQHPVWAPIEALIVSQESIGDTFDSIHERFVGTLIGVAVALLVGIFGRMIGLPLMLQIAISVTVCAMATSRRPAIRVCLWTCPLILITAPSLGTPELVGVIRVSQVLLGAIVGGMTHVLDQKVWDDRNNVSTREDTCSAELPSKRGVSRFGISRFRGQVQ